MSDPRAATLQALLDLIEAALPQALLVENVTGLMRGGGSLGPKGDLVGEEQGLRFLTDGLTQINATHGTAYAPVAFTLDAADFGVPQSASASRSDLAEIRSSLDHT